MKKVFGSFGVVALFAAMVSVANGENPRDIGNSSLQTDTYNSVTAATQEQPNQGQLTANPLISIAEGLCSRQNLIEGQRREIERLIMTSRLIRDEIEAEGNKCPVSMDVYSGLTSMYNSVMTLLNQRELTEDQLDLLVQQISELMRIQLEVIQCQGREIKRLMADHAHIK